MKIQRHVVAAISMASTGAIIRPIGNIIVLLPPLIYTDAHCEHLADVLYDSINETVAELKVAGLISDKAA